MTRFSFRLLALLISPILLPGYSVSYSSFTFTRFLYLLAFVFASLDATLILYHIFLSLSRGFAKVFWDFFKFFPWVLVFWTSGGDLFALSHLLASKLHLLLRFLASLWSLACSLIIIPHFSGFVKAFFKISQKFFLPYFYTEFLPGSPVFINLLASIHLLLIQKQPKIPSKSHFRFIPPHKMVTFH